jgi:hypothetical protein
MQATHEVIEAATLPSNPAQIPMYLLTGPAQALRASKAKIRDSVIVAASTSNF